MMLRGEVWWVDFDPSKGSEIRKKRPAVVISNNKANQYLSRIQVVPLTSNVEHVYPSETLIDVDGKKSKAMADQMMTVDKSRLDGKIDILSTADMKALEKVIKLQLGLS